MITCRNLIVLKPNICDKSPSFNVCFVEVIWRECRQMMMLLVSMFWCRRNKYKPSKWTFFQILHQNRVQNIFQCYDNNISKQMCIKTLCYSTDTYLQLNVQREKQFLIFWNRSNSWCRAHMYILTFFPFVRSIEDRYQYYNIEF